MFIKFNLPIIYSSYFIVNDLGVHFKIFILVPPNLTSRSPVLPLTWSNCCFKSISEVVMRTASPSLSPQTTRIRNRALFLLPVNELSNWDITCFIWSSERASISFFAGLGHLILSRGLVVSISSYINQTQKP